MRDYVLQEEAGLWERMGVFFRLSRGIKAELEGGPSIAKGYENDSIARSFFFFIIIYLN